MLKENEYFSNDPNSLLFSDDEGKIAVDMDRLIQGLCLMDDEFMTMCFQDNIPAVEEVLNTILDRNDLKIITLEVQHLEKSPRQGGRGIRMDVYAKDDEGKYYDIEIQRSDHGAGKHRARLYSAMMDAGMLEKGQAFDEMKDSYVIFITENDVLNGVKPIYHIRRMIVETGEIFEDGNHIIYVNGAYENDGTRLGKLIEDLKCRRPEKMHSKILGETTAHFKNTEGGVRSMCRAFEEYGNEIRQKYEAALNKKDAALSEKDLALSEKDNVIIANQAEIAANQVELAEKDNALAEKDAALFEKDEEIAFLKSELERRIREELSHKTE